MECNMKKPPDSDIAETIATTLCPLRRSKTRAQAQAGAETAIKMLRTEASRPFPDSASIKKIAGNLHKAIEPFGDGQQIPLGGCDRLVMTMRELRSALDWFEHLTGPSVRFDRAKYLCAVHADGLVNEFSKKPPTGTPPPKGQAREIAGFLYQSLAGGKWVDLKHQTDAVRRSWRDLDERLCRGREEDREGHWCNQYASGSGPRKQDVLKNRWHRAARRFRF
jgi:hypothetical protein